MKTVKIKINDTTVSVKEYLIVTYGRELFGRIYSVKDDRKVINSEIRKTLRKLIREKYMSGNLSQEVSKLLFQEILHFRDSKENHHKSQIQGLKLDKQILNKEIDRLKSLNK